MCFGETFRRGEGDADQDDGDAECQPCGDGLVQDQVSGMTATSDAGR